MLLKDSKGSRGILTQTELYQPSELRPGAAGASQAGRVSMVLGQDRDWPVALWGHSLPSGPDVHPTHRGVGRKVQKEKGEGTWDEEPSKEKGQEP